MATNRTLQVTRVIQTHQDEDSNRLLKFRIVFDKLKHCNILTMQACNLFHTITQMSLKFRTELKDYKKFMIETDPRENNNSIKKWVVFGLQTFSKICLVYLSGLYKMSLESYLSSTKHKPKYQIPCMLILSRSLVMFFLIATPEKTWQNLQ